MNSYTILFQVPVSCLILFSISLELLFVCFMVCITDLHTVNYSVTP